MNRILKYLKGRKGITLVWMAIMLAVLLMLAGMAIDIAYMYYVKNQLQVAADASSLAGTETLTAPAPPAPPVVDDGSIASQELNARQQAWKFACKNTAAGDPVFLVTNTSADPLNPRNCDSPPPSSLNETSNTATEDIVVGHWRFTTPPSGVTCEPAGSGYFCPANGSTGLTINAVKTSPRRTNETPGMLQVSLFLGQIFSLIGGADWSAMSARASAIAYRSPEHPTIPLVADPSSLCDGTCPATFTMLTLSPSTANNSGWTTYTTTTPVTVSTPEIISKIDNPDNNPDVCTPIYLTSGLNPNTGVHNPALGDIGSKYTPCCPCPTWLDDNGQSQQAPSCTVPGVGTGCQATIPMIAGGPGPGGGSACSYTGTKLVTGLIDICITAVVTTGSPKYITAYVLGCYTCDDAPLGLSSDTRLVR